MKRKSIRRRILLKLIENPKLSEAVGKSFFWLAYGNGVQHILTIDRITKGNNIFPGIACVIRP